MEKIPDHAEMRVIVGFSSPLRLVSKDETDKWSITLDEVNKSSYDYVKLNRVSGIFDGNIAPFGMVVCFDGALVIPDLPEFPNKQRAIEVFNRVFAELLIGGEYAEAVLPRDICQGSILPTGYVRVASAGLGAASKLQISLRSGEASALDSIALLQRKPMTLKDFESTVLRGRSVLASVPKFSTELLLSGCTHFVREQWSEALVCLWTSSEQLVGHLWNQQVKAETTASAIPGRSDFLSDARTWTASTKIEVLFQRQIVHDALYRDLNKARKARNAFAHEGNVPSPQEVETAIRGLFELLAICTQDDAARGIVEHARDTVLLQSRRHSESVPKKAIDPKNFIAWRRIRHIPGEQGWAGEFERFELGFIPIEEIREKSR